ncbi:MAG: Rv3235 family protein [Nocardioidaceae bacterium]
MTLIRSSTEPVATTPPGRPTLRRPPAPASGWASVTQLSTGGPAPGARERVPVAEVQGTLALDFGDRPAAPPAPDLRVVDGAGATVTPDEEVRAWAARFAQATVEVVGGDRPVSQLVRWTTPQVYRDLERRAQILSRTSPAPRRRLTVRPQVRSVHVCRPTPETAEVSVHVRYGPRSRAIAVRLERRAGRWTCTALQFG